MTATGEREFRATARGKLALKIGGLITAVGIAAGVGAPTGADATVLHKVEGIAYEQTPVPAGSAEKALQTGKLPAGAAIYTAPNGGEGVNDMARDIAKRGDVTKLEAIMDAQNSDPQAGDPYEIPNAQEMINRRMDIVEDSIRDSKEVPMIEPRGTN